TGRRTTPPSPAGDAGDAGGPRPTTSDGRLMDDASPNLAQRLDMTAKAPYPRSEYLRRILWQFVRATLFRCSPTPMYAWRRWLLRVFGAKLGHRTYFRPAAHIVHPWKFTTGNWCTLANGVVIYNLRVVRLGDHPVLSQDA